MGEAEKMFKFVMLNISWGSGGEILNIKWKY